ASPLERAFVTATILADALGIGPVQTDDDLRERHAGEYQGLTRPEIEHRFPGYLVEGLKPPGWEEDDHLVERAAGAVARVALAVGPGGTALVVTHGGLIHALERATGAARDGRLPNLGGRWFDVGPGVLAAGDEVLLVEADEVTVPNQL
ncbi:MAG TPA: histidine phosphatase family protein, partial [Acidimicrobiales bacterium]|nr:histidine phosphatase family protein [Acidimicrobiales bacterium]